MRRIFNQLANRISYGFAIAVFSVFGGQASAALGFIFIMTITNLPRARLWLHVGSFVCTMLMVTAIHYILLGMLHPWTLRWELPPMHLLNDWVRGGIIPSNIPTETLLHLTQALERLPLLNLRLAALLGGAVVLIQTGMEWLTGALGSAARFLLGGAIALALYLTFVKVMTELLTRNVLGQARRMLALRDAWHGPAYKTTFTNKLRLFVGLVGITLLIIIVLFVLRPDVAQSPGIVLLFSGLILMIVTFMSFLILHAIVRPLQELEYAATHLVTAETAELFSSSTNEEFIALSEHFYAAAQQVVEYRRRLKDLNQTLERRVAKRTAELERQEEALRASQAELKTIYQREQERRKVSDTLREVAKIVSATLDQDEVLDLILAQLEHVVTYHHASVMLLTDGELKRVAGWNKIGSTVENFVISVDQFPLNASALQHKQPLLITDVDHDDRWRSTEETTIVRSFINAPLLVQDKPIGLLGVGRCDTVPYTEEDTQIVFAFANQVAIALENARLLAETKRALRETKGLFEAAQVIRDATQLPAICQHLTNQFNKLVQADRTVLYLVDHAQRKIVHHVSQGQIEDEIWLADEQGMTYEILDVGISGRVFRTGQPILSLDIDDGLESKALRAMRLRSGVGPLIVVPLVTRGQVIGTFTALNRIGQHAFTQHDVELATVLAAQAASAIENARLFEEMQRAKESAEAANHAKSAFLANMSHELRTPLNAILGFSELMRRDPQMTPMQRENLETIDRSGEHLLALINDVLEFSKIEAGRVELQEQDFDLHHLLVGLEEMFRMRATHKGLMLTFEQCPDLPQYIHADENKLRQVLINLLGNAVKFTDEGNVTLRMACKQEQDSRLTLIFEVADTGPGIAPEELEAVFDAFVQTESGQKSQEGTGLGLPISQQFVRMMGGQLKVHSTLGQGSVFTFDIVASRANASEVETAQPVRRVIGLEPGQPVWRLLVVEDRESNRQLLTKLLLGVSVRQGGKTSPGFEVREATNGQEAIAIWKAWSPHLIWMDMRMPVLDGYAATRHIKASPQGNATIIIALTASAFEEDRETVLAEGCDDFVRKPFRETEIFDMLAKHLDVRFIYDNIADAAPTGKSLGSELTSEALTSLPADIVNDLHQATLEADAEWTLDLIQEIHSHNPTLAEKLRDLINDFRFDLVLTWLQ